MHVLKTVAVAAALALGTGGAMAATPAKAPVKAPAASETEDAMLYLKVLISGLQSDKVEQPVKGALVGCLYNNSLGKITESMDKVIAENPGKIHRDNPSELLSVMARICGYNPNQTAPGTAPAGR